MAKYQPMFTVRISGLKGALQMIALAIINLGEHVSELTESVDAALAAFTAAENDEDAAAEAAAALAAATIASLEAQIAELEAGGAANIAELEKVRDALVALTPTAPDPDPAPVDEPVEPA